MEEPKQAPTLEEVIQSVKMSAKPEVKVQKEPEQPLEKLSVSSSDSDSSSDDSSSSSNSDSSSSDSDTSSGKDSEMTETKKKVPIDTDSTSDYHMEEPVAPKMGQNIYQSTRRAFTLTLVVPSSIVDNAQSLELKTYLVG